MHKLRIGIIGCGNIFPMHAVPVSELALTELVAVCDIKEDRAKAASKQFNCKYYLDYQEMMEKEHLDSVHLCLPHYLHAPVAIYAASKKINVLTEKPMATSVNDAMAMIKACKDNGVMLGVILQNRYNPGAQFVKKSLTDSLLGKIYAAKMQVTWDRSDEYYSHSDWKGTWDKEGGGVIIDQALHTLDLMNWFIGSDIEYIEASIANRMHEKIEVEDTAEGVIHFKNGVNGSFFTINYYTDNSPVEIEMHCEKGYVKYVDGLATISLHDGRTFTVGNNPHETFNYGGGKGYWGVSHVKQIKDHYERLYKGEKPEITGEEALITQKIVNAIYDSGKEHKRIYF